MEGVHVHPVEESLLAILTENSLPKRMYGSIMEWAHYASSHIKVRNFGAVVHVVSVSLSTTRAFRPQTFTQTHRSVRIHIPDVPQPLDREKWPILSKDIAKSTYILCGVVYVFGTVVLIPCAPCCYRDRKQDNPSVYIMKKNTKKRKRQKERKGDHVKPKKEVSKEAAQDSNMPWAWRLQTWTKSTI